MKKYGILALLAVSLWGCSGQTETATESTTAGIDVKGDGFAEWVARMQQNPEVLTALQEISLENAQNAAFESLCDDTDVRTAMETRQYRPVVIHADRDDTQTALEILHSIPSHGSKFVPPHLEEIETLAQKHSQDEPMPVFSWEASDAPTLEQNLRTLGFDLASNTATETFVTLLKGTDCEKILPRYCQHVQKLKTEQAEAQKTATRLDALLTCDLSLWASELRLNYPANDYKFDRFRKYMSDDSVVSVRKQVFIEDMAKRGVKAAFKTIAPPDPQYEALRKVRQYYVDALAAGGWPEVEAPKKITEAKIDKPYPYVPSLRKRLKAEGYHITDTESDIYDQALNDAVVLYREVHQLSPKKVIDNVFFRNLSVGPQPRLDVIDMTLQRYRESAIGSLNYYLKVNIPDFHVEVWRDGERIARHRIVVGNDKVQKDPVTNNPVPDPETLYAIHPNRTPIQTSKINEIIYNPYWNVPARIRIEELEPELAKNPNYYIENNYEEVNVGDPRLYYVRELPNPKNSLGKVKLMFPNPHNTYLHDTPHKAVFKLPTRALSHGCMRVQNPLDLARLILENDGQWDARKVKEILEAEMPEQVSIMLKHPVDVDVVYLNARVDDSGVCAFLSDVYQYDAVRMGKVQLKKLPKSWLPKPAE